jgi:hypothetical protein
MDQAPTFTQPVFNPLASVARTKTDWLPANTVLNDSGNVVVKEPPLTVALTAPASLQRELRSPPAAAGPDCQAPLSPNKETKPESVARKALHTLVLDTLGPTIISTRRMSAGPLASQTRKATWALKPAPLAGVADTSTGGCGATVTLQVPVYNHPVLSWAADPS